MPRRRRNPSFKRRRSRQTSSRGEPRDATILFVDVVGCSEISNHSTLQEYKDFIATFQKCFTDVCEFYKKEVYEKHEHVLFKHDIRGDEGCLKIFVGKKADSLARDIDVAITIALELKRMWLIRDYNKKRIKQGLLPVDLAVGIHFGQVYVKGGNAEGYAINLAKRIESHSREGKFTHILLSETAHEQLYYLKDEKIYKFGQHFTVKVKGISHPIKVVEIKHHFLPTDWQDMMYYEPSETSMAFKKYKEKGIAVVKAACKINPTNLWLLEVHIWMKLMDVYHKLREKRMENDPNARKKEYAPVLELARRIARSFPEDATPLLIWGQILGEMGDYAKEEKKYSI